MNHIEKLIIKKWNGSATDDELMKLNEHTSSLNEVEKEAYQKLEAYWKSEGLDSPEVNQTQLWNRLEHFIDNQQVENDIKSKPEKGIVIPIINWRIFSIAASIALFFTFGYYLWDGFQQGLKNDTAQIEDIDILQKENLAGHKSTLKLPDGSTVILNSKSKLFIPEKFVGETREVTLEGEAYFDIVPNANMPFIVNTNGAKVRVLGTAFNLRNTNGTDEVVLNVVEGKVNFTGRDSQENLLVKANQAATLDKSTGKVAPISFDPDAVAWSKGELVFKSATFIEIVNALESWYGVDIEFRENILFEDGYSGRFKNSSLKEVLEGIGHSLEFESEIKAKKVFIRK